MGWIEAKIQPESLTKLKSEDDLTAQEVREILFDILFGENQTEIAAKNEDRPACPLPRTLAKTKITTQDFTANLQFWLLKPKLQFLRNLHPTLSRKLDAPYNEVVLKENGLMYISYEFLQPTDCTNLVAFSEKIVSYSSEVDEITAECECNVYVIRKKL
ncbi:unnamed protein product [Bursaphelenchus xylophilus]|uniref:(pine wood nematode) hypothetical protein n=1 Tax=Bursaphelenchus xylophilus TaxID=6326 RepID=A0A1I7RSH4_BURXY|nr:unnamed protein product [Bursaphelenchus xylophilus]CAG9122941.1 unnamed protein product [Bursaphelenchus xylophilus]